METLDENDLETVFEMCQPRGKDRKISLRRFQSLFEEHTAANSIGEERKDFLEV